MKHPGIKSTGWALMQTARLHRSRMGDKLAGLDLFAGQEQVIQALASEGKMTMGELATILRVRPPTASKTISRLAALKLVERTTESGDARVVRVKLTREGKRKAAAIDDLWNEVEEELLEGFDAKERKRMRKLLRKSAKNLAKLNGADLDGFDAPEDELDDAEPDAQTLADGATDKGKVEEPEVVKAKPKAKSKSKAKPKSDSTENPELAA